MACQIYFFCISPPAGVACVQIKKKKTVSHCETRLLSENESTKKLRVKLKMN